MAPGFVSGCSRTLVRVFLNVYVPQVVARPSFAAHEEGWEASRDIPVGTFRRLAQMDGGVIQVMLPSLHPHTCPQTAAPFAASSL